MKIDFGTPSSGIQIDFIKSRQVLYISGYYDHYVGIEGKEFTLKEFCTRLGITSKMVAKAEQDV